MVCHTYCPDAQAPAAAQQGTAQQQAVAAASAQQQVRLQRSWCLL
jgi:hypothetical protein